MENKEIKLGVSLGNTENQPKFLVLHCSDVSYTKIKDQFNSINNYHRDVRDFYESKTHKGIFIGYHYLYTGGKEYICKDDNEVGCHCNQGYDGINVYPAGTQGKLSVNYQSIGLCLGFDGDIEMPPVIEYGLLQKRVWELQDKYNIPDSKVFFHRKFINKTCPGELITQNWLDTLLKRPEIIHIPDKPADRMCMAEETKINELEKEVKYYKERLSWYEQLVNWFFGR